MLCCRSIYPGNIQYNVTFKLDNTGKNNENLHESFISLWRLDHSNEAPDGVMLPAHFHDVNYDHIWSETLQELTKSPEQSTYKSNICEQSPNTEAKYVQEQYTRAIPQH